MTNLANVLTGKKWTQKDGIIYLSATSYSMTAEERIARLEGKGVWVGCNAKQLLCPTSSVTTTVAILKGEIFRGKDRVTKKIRDKANKLKFATLKNEDISCVIDELLMNEKLLEEMGLWSVVAMHEPIDYDGNPRLLSANRYDIAGWLNAYCGNPDRRWRRYHGFAFSV